MTISMSQVQTIRQLKKEGESIAGISRKVGVSRGHGLQVPGERRLLARDAGEEAGEVDHGTSTARSSRATSRRTRAAGASRGTRRRGSTSACATSTGCEASESTVRHYVARIRKECVPSASSFLTLVWAPGEAQADFGEADFYLNGVRTRLFYLVVTFPFSNVGLAQVFRGADE